MATIFITLYNNSVINSFKKTLNKIQFHLSDSPFIKRYSYNAVSDQQHTISFFRMKLETRHCKRI